MSLFKRFQDALKQAMSWLKTKITAIRTRVAGRVDDQVDESASLHVSESNTGEGAKDLAPQNQDLMSHVSNLTSSAQQDAILMPNDPCPMPPSTEEPTFDPITRKNFLKHPIFWARFLGYAIPLSFLLYVLYLNYLPFGYHKTFTINVGSANDTKVSEFYLEPSKDLSDATTTVDGMSYRLLNGMATAIFKPNVVLKNTNITIEVKGDDGISLIPPQIDFDSNSVKWDYDWNFENAIPKNLNNIGNHAFTHADGIYFDGTAHIEMASSSALFEDKPFTIYTEWMPTDDTGDAQQIAGHFNWEIWQNKNSVSFQLGRVDNKDGQIYTIKYPIDSDFFNTRHSALAIYAPSDTNGYFEFFVDGKFVGKINLGASKIWKDYGTNNLSFGWTSHNYGKNPYFKGQLYKIGITNSNVISNSSKINFTTNNDTQINIPLISNTTTTLKKIYLDAIQR